MAITNSKSLTQLVGEGIGMAYGTATLTDATPLVIETGLSDVKVALASVENDAAGAASYALLVEYNASSDLGKIQVTATGATGTTLIYWLAIGIGQR